MTRALTIEQSSAEFDAEATFCLSHNLELQHASDYGWIVREATLQHDGAVIGCIDQLDDGVELMRLEGGFHWSAFTSLHDALEDLTKPESVPADHSSARFLVAQS